MADQQNAKLPSPIDVFSPDARIERVIVVEQALLAEHGIFYAPNAQNQLQYFASHIDARYWRRLAAQRTVREEERIAKLAEAYQRATEMRGDVLPGLRQLAEAQKAEFEKTGKVA